MSGAQAKAEWLGWDGARLSWRVAGATSAPIELRLDGIAFQRYGAAKGEQEYACEFEYSPTGLAELSFSVSAGALALLTPWRVRHGETAQRGANVPAGALRGLTRLAGTPQLPSQALATVPPAAVIVPIYNSPHCVKRCIESVLRWSPSVQLILVDDASTDARVGEVLAAHAGRANVLISRNERNRGYTHSVNVGMRLAGGADVVLLNSDTEVGPRWLSALRIAAYGAEDIGTVTAVSDNAGAFTVPELEQHCPVPARWTLVQAQRAVLQQAGLRHPKLPTGNGFCMYVKRMLIARIGPMDEAAFPEGYGEENDFCQRAERAGYRNIIAGHVLVHHERSASFGDARRARLGEQGMAVLRERYPDYEEKVGATLFGYDRRVLDYRVRRTYADTDGRYLAQAPRPRILVAADAADADVERLVAALDARQECFLLRREGAWVNLYRYVTGATLVFERGIAIGSDAAALREIELRLREWLLEYAIESVHARGSAASDGWLAGLATTLDIPTT